MGIVTGISVDHPTGWPRPATPNTLVPRWVGEFRDFDDWVCKASTRLAGATANNRVGNEVASICIDAIGRRCTVGADFMRARDEGTFPVRFFWEMQEATHER